MAISVKVVMDRKVFPHDLLFWLAMAAMLVSIRTHIAQYEDTYIAVCGHMYSSMRTPAQRCSNTTSSSGEPWRARHTSACVSMRQHTSVCVSMRQHTTLARHGEAEEEIVSEHIAAMLVSIRTLTADACCRMLTYADVCRLCTPSTLVLFSIVC